MKQDLVDRLMFMSQIAKRSGLKNLAVELIMAAQEVASMKWELKVLKQKKGRKG